MLYMVTDLEDVLQPAHRPGRQSGGALLEAPEAFRRRRRYKNLFLYDFCGKQDGNSQRR